MVAIPPVALILTWNVAGRVRAAPRQVEAVLAGPWDVVALQEITPTTRATWVEALTGAGYGVATSAWTERPEGLRRLAVLLAARGEVRPLPSLDGLPWPERHLAVRTVIEDAETEVHTLHAPLSQKAERVKVRTLET